MQKLRPDEPRGGYFVAHTKRLREFSTFFFQVITLPLCFQSGVVSDDEAAKVFLQDHLLFEFQLLRPAEDLAIERKTKQVGRRVCQIINQFKR